MTDMVSIAGTLAFLLEDNPETESVTPQTVLHAVARRFTERTQYMPQGMTYADAWMARYGDPLASTEAALKMVHEMGDTVENLELSVFPTIGRALCRIYFQEPPHVMQHAEAQSLPLAIAIAALNHAAAKESTV